MTLRRSSSWTFDRAPLKTLCSNPHLSPLLAVRTNCFGGLLKPPGCPAPGARPGPVNLQTIRGKMRRTPMDFRRRTLEKLSLPSKTPAKHPAEPAQPPCNGEFRPQKKGGPRPESKTRAIFWRTVLAWAK